MSSRYLLFDIGGTNIRSAFSKDGKVFDGEPKVVRTPKSWQEAKEVLSAEIKQYDKPDSVCVAIAGEFDASKSKLAYWKNQQDWVDKPLKDLFEKETNAQVKIINDASAAAIAEAREGAGRGFDIVAYLTVGTGVGGARVVKGALDENTSGFEPGRQIIDADSKDTLESRIAGSGFIRRFGPDFLKSTPPSAWEKAASDLALGIGNTLDYWSPDIVVLGGSMILKPLSIPLEIVISELESIHGKFGKIPPIKKAEFGDQSGLRGALLVAKE